MIDNQKLQRLADLLLPHYYEIMDIQGKEDSDKWIGIFCKAAKVGKNALPVHHFSLVVGFNCGIC